MLLWLSQWLAQDVRAFNVFGYITLRTVLAAMTALIISFVAGPRLIRWLAAKKIGQAVRNDGPQTHLMKSGTPTMGGALILIAIIITTLLWGDLGNRYVWVVLIVTVGFGGIGWYDDWQKVVHRNPRGLAARWKYFWQSALGLMVALYLGLTASGPAQLELIVPFFKTVAYPLGLIGFVVLSYLVVVGTSNAVNLTDGLDGLAIMPTVMIAAALAIFAYVAGNAVYARYLLAALAIFAYVAGNAVYARYLLLPYVPGAGELAILLGAMAGAGLGFLWFNAYPAEVFMGDVGALALGAALGTVAIIVRQEIVLAIMGGVFVAETLSVAAQVLFYKMTGGRRIFRMAPLHHHFELGGWKETQVVVRFWIITIMLVLVGLSTLKLR